jgi:L-ascorbate metabolism protein UlaG (beta-lactamase superfamily)
MKITWLGHSGFRIEAGGQVLLIDPWLTGNPVFPAARRAEAIKGATAILVSHGHGDHSGDAAAIAKETGAKIVGVYELASWLAAQSGAEAVAMNKGGTAKIGDVAVTLVAATHSSSVMVDDRPMYVGGECGFMIAAEGQTIYFSGDTDVMADMGIFAELHRPTIGILPIGGFYTMDIPRAAYACRKFFDFKAVIPCHYKTFPALAQSAAPLAEAIAPVPVHALEVMGSVSF